MTDRNEQSGCFIIVTSPPPAVPIHPYLLIDRDQTNDSESINKGKRDVEESYHCVVTWYLASIQNQFLTCKSDPLLQGEETSAAYFRQQLQRMQKEHLLNQQTLRSFLYQITFEHTEHARFPLLILESCSVYGAGWLRLLGENIPNYTNGLEGLLIEKSNVQEILNHQNEQRTLVLSEQLFHIGVFLQKAVIKFEDRIQKAEEVKDKECDLVLFKNAARDILLLLESDILNSAKRLQKKLDESKVYSEEVSIFPSDRLVTAFHHCGCIGIFGENKERKLVRDVSIVTAREVMEAREKGEKGITASKK
jgi:hypothetical protein